MIIDKKGKLFGKINIIDLLIVIVLVAAVLLVGYKTVAPGLGIGDSAEGVNGQNAEVFIEFFAEEVPDFAVDGTINNGDKVIEVGTDTMMGEVVEVEIGDSISYASDDSGNWVAGSKPNYKSVRIKCKGTADYYEHGCKIKGAKYYIGHTMTIAAGKAKLYLKISDIEYTNQELK